MQLSDGKYMAKAIEWSQVTAHEKTGNEEIRVLFKVVEYGEWCGQTITWRGYFTEKTAERTIESLRYMGWTGTDITDVQGLDANEVQLVVQSEEYQGKTQVKVAFVNKLSRVFVGTPLDDAKKRDFANRMKGLVLATKASAGPGPAKSATAAGGAAEDFPFGANAPPKSAGGVKL